MARGARSRRRAASGRSSRGRRPRRDGKKTRLDLPAFVPYRITVLATLVRRGLAEIYRDDPGLTEPEWKVMTTLAHYGPLPSADIGLYVTLDRVAVSRALARLMRLKLATRRRNAADQRMYVVDLTASAARRYDRMAGDARALERRMLAGLKPADVRRLLTLLDRIETSLRSPADQQRLALMLSRNEAGAGAAKGRHRPRG